MSNGPSSKALLTLALIGACGVAAIAFYVKSDPSAAHVPPALRAPGREAAVELDPRPTESSPRHKSSRSPKAQGASVFLPEIAGEDATLASNSTELPEGSDAKVFLTEHVLKAENLSNVKVLGVSVKGGTATIDFGDGVDDGMGSSQEASFLKALQLGFGQFPEVSKIQITKKGQPLDSLGGHIELTDPLPVLRPPQP